VPLVTTAQAASTLCVTPKTVYEWHKYGCPKIPIGSGAYCYDLDELKAWVEINGYGTGRPGPRKAWDKMRARAAGAEGTNPYKTKDGKFVATGEHYYDVGKTKEQEAAAEGLTVEQLDKLKQDTMATKLRKEGLMADKYQHQLDLLRGQVVDKGEVQRERLQRIMSVKAKLLSMPGKMANRLAGRTIRDIQVELEREVREILAEFARGEEEEEEEAQESA